MDPGLLVVDAANVVGSRPTGWWRDRAGAARGLVDRVGRAVEHGALEAPVTVVLEGAARGGFPSGPCGNGVEIVHATASGDDAIVAVVTAAGSAHRAVSVVTADRGLRDRVRERGATVVGPGWLLERLDEVDRPAR